jgi:LacI family transcriptional regulator
MKKRSVNEQKITQTELARRLGVSQMTVSRVLNNRPGVKPEVQKKIRKGMKKYNYVPDRIASGLRSSTTNVIGLVIPNVTDSFFPDITRSVEKEAKKHGFSIILSHSNELYDLECEELLLLRGFRVRGYIIAPSGNQNDIHIYEELQKDKVPFVFIDRIKKKISSSYVVTDIKRGSYEIGTYLASKGYRKWGYLKGPKGVFSSDQHEKGLKEALKKLAPSKCMMVSVQAGFREEDGYEAIKKLLRKSKPDVIVAVNDLVAIGSYRYLKEHNLRVPQDIGLVGFSDLRFVDILEVPLTTVREPTSEIGKKAMEVLLEEINNPSRAKQQVVLEPKLIIRKSSE